jgi:hypothetical protein
MLMPFQTPPALISASGLILGDAHQARKGKSTAACSTSPAATIVAHDAAEQS